MRKAYLEVKDRDYDLVAAVVRLQKVKRISTSLWSANGTFRSTKTSRWILRVLFSEKLGTDFLKFIIQHWVDALDPDIKKIPIDKDVFANFLLKEGAKDDSWTMKFWEINHTIDFSRSLTAWRESPTLWSTIETALASASPPRNTEWAGVEFTHPTFERRAAIYRYPTAAFWGIGVPLKDPNLSKIQKKFEDLL
jgi:hypothetical protein